MPVTIPAAQATHGFRTTVEDYARDGLRPPVSVLERAASYRLDDALHIVRKTLCLTPDDFTSHMILPDEWARANNAQRIQLLASYITAEAHASIHRLDESVPMPVDLQRFVERGIRD